MAVSKADLAVASKSYLEHLIAAGKAVDAFDYPAALRHAVDSLEHLDNRLQFKRKEPSDIDDEFHAERFILQLSPPLFSHESIDRWAEVLKGQRRLKAYFVGAEARIELAHEQVDDCRDVWNIIANGGSLDAYFEGSDKPAKSVGTALVVWENMGLICTATSDDGAAIRRGWRDQRMSAKCPHCGATARTKRRGFIHPLECPRCHKVGDFVVVAPVQS